MTVLEAFNGSNWFSVGTVTSVGITGSTGLSVTGSPVTNNATIALALAAELQALSQLANTGVIARTGAATYLPRTITGTSPITVTNGNGVSGNPTIALSAIDINNNTTGSLNIARLQGYPSDPSIFLNGNGGWVDPLNVTVNALAYNILLNNINLSSTNTGLIVRQNGNNAIEFGFNSSTNEGYVWAVGSATLKFGTNATKRMELLNDGTLNLVNNNLLTTGNVNVQTGGIICNNLSCYNSTAIVCNSPISINASYTPYNGNYGYLNSSGSVGTASGQNGYSLNCTNRVKASEFNAVSSKRVKNIIATGESIEQEAIDIFKLISLTKYNYKDKINEGDGEFFGVIAEELNPILPHYVSQDYSFVPNIFQECVITKLNNNMFSLRFNQNLDKIEGKKLRLIAESKNIELNISKIQNKRLVVKTEENLPNKAFAYGTYEECPSVAKQKLFELSMVVLKNALKRIEVLEQKICLVEKYGIL